jgi:7-cyano-7-deazaguanine tRNA-ribosyltransferase
MFELKYRDAMGRAGIIHVRGKKVRTPAVLPVINPRFQEIPPGEIKEMGFEGIITNSYIIRRDEELKAKVREKGLHRFLGFDGLIMTDSGSFQLYKYGEVEVSSREIIDFQEEIGSDIGVILDIPTPPDVKRKRAEADLRETLRRAKEAGRAGDMLLAGTVQGSTYLDLREESAKAMGALDFDIHPIGGVVPLMENYRYADLARVILHSKEFLPPEPPVHLFGCGHPMVFALAVALGCDLFDSAAYALYAKDGRYITPRGTSHLDTMTELPCSCPVCSDHSPRELLSLEKKERTNLLARHNLHATLEEMKRVKNAMAEGSLWELVQERARAHPALLEGLKAALGYEIVERHDPVTKNSAFFYSGPESLQRPEVRRHMERLTWIQERGRTLVLLPDSRKPYSHHYGTFSNRDYHICVLSPVFGIVPTEIDDVYPLSQHVSPNQPDRDQLEFMVSAAREYARGFRRVLIHPGLEGFGIEGEKFDDLPALGKGDNILKIRAMADYQFGRGAGRTLFPEGTRAEWARTGRLRRIYLDRVLLFTGRASDGLLVPTREGAERLLSLPCPRNRVVVADQEAAGYVREGKSVFAGFVSDCDPSLRPYQEVVVVDGDDTLLAAGRALLSGTEMIGFKKGVAVKTRHRSP